MFSPSETPPNLETGFGAEDWHDLVQIALG
jgi:hypothetical protein